jgi:predicted Rossmann fold nucleotide-binding protein DprA/Smf involved in DNA uptake
LKQRINQIISGGQTGADRAAFDFALENGIEMGGFVPLGRRAEDGPIADKYPNLVETATRNYQERTELNIINSDATIILSHGKLKGGSRLTRRLAKRHKKPFLHIDFSEHTLRTAGFKAQDFLRSIDGKTLNIAGPRASGDEHIYQKTKDFLTLLFD